MKGTGECSNFVVGLHGRQCELEIPGGDLCRAHRELAEGAGESLCKRGDDDAEGDEDDAQDGEVQSRESAHVSEEFVLQIDNGKRPAGSSHRSKDCSRSLSPNRGCQTARNLVLPGASSRRPLLRGESVASRSACKTVTAVMSMLGSG